MLLGQLAEAAALCFLFSVSEALEDWAVTRARRGLRALLSLVPPTTWVRRGSDRVELATDELVVGDVVVLRVPFTARASGVDVEVVSHVGIYGDEHGNHVALFRQLPELACR